MSTPAPTGAERVCPHCGYPIPPGRHSLCPNCHHPLIFDEHDETAGAVASTGLHKPTESTVPIPDVAVAVARDATAPQAAGAGLACPACGHRNEPDRLRCERCASTLVAQPALPPPPPPPVPAPRRRTGLLVGLVGAALVLALGLGYAAFRLSRPTAGTAPTPPSIVAPTLTPRPTSAPRLTKVTRRSIKAKASSTLPSGPEYTYGIKNTLDGDPATAWNSDGDRVGPFARVTLTYRFSKPVELRAIEIYNGYQRSTESYDNNSRVRSLLVVTDATKQTFSLRDRQGKQTLTFDFGKTKKVVMTVDAVFRDTPRKTLYNDCAVSEVAFYRS